MYTAACGVRDITVGRAFSINSTSSHHQSSVSERTSMDLRSDCRWSSGRRSLGKKSRMLLIDVMSWTRTGTTAISFWRSLPFAGRGMRVAVDRRVSLSQFRRTSTTYCGSGSSSWPILLTGFGCFFWKVTTTPQPNSSSPLRTCGTFGNAFLAATSLYDLTTSRPYYAVSITPESMHWLYLHEPPRLKEWQAVLGLVNKLFQLQCKLAQLLPNPVISHGFFFFRYFYGSMIFFQLRNR